MSDSTGVPWWFSVVNAGKSSQMSQQRKGDAMKRIKFDSLVGETLTHIDVDKDKDVILLTTQSGRQIVIEHDQDCCEYVRIVDTKGEWHTLIGKVIIEASADETCGGGESDGSCTETTLTFKVSDSTVICRWFGESNGYYSEDVDIKELTAE